MEKMAEVKELKRKLSALWFFVAVVYLVFVVFSLFEPGVLDQISSGVIDGEQITPELMLFLTTIMMVPPVMAFLSLTLSDSVNRWANIVAGVVYTVLELLALVDIRSAHLILMTGLKIVASALIAWYAWKWPK